MRLTTVASLVSLWLFVGPGCSSASDVELAVVRQGDLIIGVDVSGALEAVDSLPIRPPGLPNVWQYKVQFLAPEGSEVKPGDRLVGFDSSDQMRELETLTNQAESAATEIRRQASSAKMARQDEGLALAERQAAVDKLQLKVDQPQDLVSLIELKTTRIQLDLEKIQLEHARARLALAKRSDAATIAGLRDKLDYANTKMEVIKANLARMTVMATKAGTVIHTKDGRGEKVKAGDSVWRMRTLIDLVALDAMRGAGVVDEVDSSRVEPGRSFTMRVDAHPDTEIVGVVGEISDGFTPKSQADPSKVVKVKLDIPDAKGLPLRPGMRFRGEIEVDRVPGTLSVPIAAVFVEADGPLVYLRSGNGFERVLVTVGTRSAREIEIKAGLSAGDQVALEVPES